MALGLLRAMDAGAGCSAESLAGPFLFGCWAFLLEALPVVGRLAADEIIDRLARGSDIYFRAGPARVITLIRILEGRPN